jgi:hypothetical protein
MMSSIFSYGTVGLLAIKNPVMLGVAYLGLALLNGLAFAAFQRARVGVVMRPETNAERVADAETALEEAAA